MKLVKRSFSLILSLLIILSMTVISDYGYISSVTMTAYAAGENYYMINGKTVRYDTAEAQSNDEYIAALYKYIWGIEFTNDFNSTDNILKNESYENRALSAENLKKFVLRCQPGAVLRVENIRSTEVSSTQGRTAIVVNHDANGFSVYEYTDERHEKYYTWAQFCNTYTYSTIRFIKWPNSFYASGSESEDTDYNKPTRPLYYDAQSMLKGDDVRWVQQKLKDIGYSVIVDGYFSKHTENAVELFQYDYSLTVTGIVESTTADMLEHPVKKPGKISLSVLGDKDLSIGDVLTIEWGDVNNADSYHLFVYNNRGNLVDELDRITVNRASFVMNSSGTYIVKGCAQNSAFVGEMSTMEQKVKVHNTYSVKFFDDDGTLLNKQTVAYGQDASVPASPKKTGYSFKGWDKEFTNVTSSLTINALYIKKSYTVRFEDASGTIIGKSQKVLYGESAVEPDTSTIDGFIGWNKDFSFVTSSMTVTAVVNLSGKALPFSVSNGTAARESESSGYTVNFKVTNNSDSKKIGRAVVALKTTAGKFLTLTESSAFAMSPAKEKTMKVFVPYDKAATIVEIYIVADYSDLIPMSQVAVIDNISTDNNFTDWLPKEEAPAAGTYFSVTEPRTEYRYRDKEFDNNKDYSSRPGWTQYKITPYYTDSGWSSYTVNQISPKWEKLLTGETVQTRFIQTKNESYDTGYHIESHCSQGVSSPYYRHYWQNRTVERQSYGCWDRSADVSIDYWNSLPSVGAGGWSKGNYPGQNKGGVTGKYDGDAYIWFIKYTNQSQRTLYQYNDRIYRYKYSFFKFKEWEPWSTTPVSETNDREVETRETRRYEVNDPTVVNTGVARTITGIVDSSLAGKQATLFIYKIGEASDYTNEFVGQTTIGENGSYKFSFKLLDEPSTISGDYTVALGIEGASSVIYLDDILAPKPQYTVNICDEDGTILDTQTVSRGDSAVLPKENPTKPGYTFAGWNYSNASIFEDTNITATYVRDEYTVTFIDWTNERFEMQTGYHYGDPLMVPDLNIDNDAYVPVCWDGITENMTVTQNMVITAKYDVKEFTVKFYDFDKNLISEQIVNYGSTVDAPVLNSTDEIIFLSWDSSSIDHVVNDLDVYPVYCYAKTVATPVATLDGGVYSNDISVSISCSTPEAKIYYSLYTEDEEIEEHEYNEPITVAETSTLSFYAACDGFNDSKTTVNCYAINKDDNEENRMYPVRIYYENSLIVEKMMKSGSVITDELISEYVDNEYEFEGFYTDSRMTNPLPLNTTVTETMTIYAKIQPKTYNVKFCFEDGTVIDEQSVTYLDRASVPENIDVNPNKVFIGWDSDEYLCVTKDVVITAIVKDSTYLADISLNKTRLVMISGMNYNLIAAIAPETFAENTIFWTSSNTSVVKVDADGLVTAISPGTAVITAKLIGDVERTATCEIIVKRNSDENITLTDGSYLLIEGGKLLGVKPAKNTVSDIVSELDSTNVVAYSSEGEELSAHEKLETGSTICLVDNNGNILDVVTVIVMGDVNGDGVVNNKDAALIHRFVVGREPNAFTDENYRLAADVDGDNFITTKDSSLILTYLEGMNNILSV